MRVTVRELSLKVRAPWPPHRKGTQGKQAQQSVWGSLAPWRVSAALCRVPWAGHEWGGDPWARAGRAPAGAVVWTGSWCLGGARPVRATAVLTAQSPSSSRDAPREAPSVQWGARPQMAQNPRRWAMHTAKEWQRRAPVSSSAAQSLGQMLTRLGWAPRVNLHVPVDRDALQSGHGELCVWWTAVHTEAFTCLLRVAATLCTACPVPWALSGLLLSAGWSRPPKPPRKALQGSNGFRVCLSKVAFIFFYIFILLLTIKTYWRVWLGKEFWLETVSLLTQKRRITVFCIPVVLLRNPKPCWFHPSSQLSHK